MKTNKKTPSIVGVLIAIVLLLTIVITRCNTVQQSGDQQQQATPAPTVPAYTGYRYSDETVGLSLMIPEDWTKVIMHGDVMFIDARTAASVRISVNDRTPETLNYNDSSAMEYVGNIGGTFSQFSRPLNDRFVIEYSVGDTDYIEYHIYDRVTELCFTCSVPDGYYRDYVKTFEQLLGSITWNPKDKIPAGIVLLYNEHGSYEYGLPEKWISSQTDKAFYAQNETGDATMSIICEEGERTFSDYTQQLFAEENSDKFSNLEFRRFSVDRSIIYVEGVYYRGEFKTMLIRYALSSNGSTYTITFIAPYDGYEKEAQIYTDAIRVFKIIK